MYLWIYCRWKGYKVNAQCHYLFLFQHYYCCTKINITRYPLKYSVCKLYYTFTMAKKGVLLQLLFGYCQNHIQHLRNLIYCIGLGNAQIKSTHLHQSHITHIWYKSAHAWMDFAEVVSQMFLTNVMRLYSYCGSCCVRFGYLQYYYLFFKNTRYDSCQLKCN